MLHKIAKSSGYPAIKTDSTAADRLSISRISIMTTNDMFGLEEIMLQRKIRTKTVECVSTAGECLFISKADFHSVVRKFEFSQQVLEELLVKHQSHGQRLEQTYDFQR